MSHKADNSNKSQGPENKEFTNIVKIISNDVHVINGKVLIFDINKQRWGKSCNEYNFSII